MLSFKTLTKNFNVKYLAIVLSCCASSAFAQTTINADDLAKLPGKHASDPVVQQILKQDGIVIDQSVRGMGYRPGKDYGVTINANKDNFITGVWVSVGRAMGTLPYGFKKTTKYKAAKKKLKKTGDFSTPTDIIVLMENNVKLKLDFTSKGEWYDFGYSYSGTFPAVNLPDQDSDGTPDYCDSCYDFAGPAYKFGCPLVADAYYLGGKPDAEFNDAFVRIHSDFEFGFQNVLGTELSKDENGHRYFSVKNGIGMASEEVIRVRADSNPQHYAYIATFYPKDSADVRDLGAKLDNMLRYGQMTSIIRPDEVKYFYKYCGGCTKYSDQYGYMPYNQVECGIYLKTLYNCQGAGKHCVKLYMGYMPEFY
jgi:hypothetical protein